jgi:glycosyltransferase involved in cell wall biosynthesis
MKLSVIICTYNREKELKRALECVFGQQVNFSFEVIVGNDCSTDGTPALLASFKEKHSESLVVNTLEKNSGVGTNWAKAVMLARGEYLAFLDDDDYWTDPKRMQTMVDYLEAHQDVNLLYTNGYSENEKGKRKLITYPEGYPDLHLMWQGKQNCIQLNMMMVRKSLLDECINLDDYVKYRFPIQDWNTNILLLRKAKCAFLDMPTCVLSYTSGSLMHPKSYEQIKEKYRYSINRFENKSARFSLREAGRCVCMLL